MSRTIILVSMAAAIMLAGCQGEGFGTFTKEHKGGLIGGAIGGGIGALAGRAVGRNTTGTLIGAGVGAGLGYLLGNELDKKKAREHNIAEPTELTGTKWHVTQLNMPNPPAYRDMYLSFEPNSQLVTTTVTSDGRVLRAVETYRITDHTLIINRAAVGDQPGYIINADFNKTDAGMTVSSPQFGATLRPVNEVPG